MGVFAKLFAPKPSRATGKPSAPVAPPPSAVRPAPGPAHPAGPARPERQSPPIAIDLHAEDDPDDELEGFDPGREPLPEIKPPRSRQELIAELQRNYQEVLGIVRKVDSHLDEQGQRSHRMAEIAERFPRAADDLAHLREGQGSVQQTLEAVSLALRERDEALTEGQRGTLARLEEIRGLLAESSESERQLVGSLVEFRDMMSGMNAATERLSEAVERIDARESERVNVVVRAIGGIKSSVVAVGVIATSCAVIAMLVGFAALIF
ncbi:MAG: hypothetical protein ACF8LK_06250 [Phycisphaerales bacterium JB041]